MLCVANWSTHKAPAIIAAGTRSKVNRMWVTTNAPHCVDNLSAGNKFGDVGALVAPWRVSWDQEQLSQLVYTDSTQALSVSLMANDRSCAPRSQIACGLVLPCYLTLDAHKLLLLQTRELSLQQQTRASALKWRGLAIL